MLPLLRHTVPINFPRLRGGGPTAPGHENSLIAHAGALLPGATASQDWKRATAVSSAGTPSLSTCREVGSSSRGGQRHHVKIVYARGVAAGDLGLLVLRHPCQDLRQDLPRLR